MQTVQLIQHRIDGARRRPHPGRAHAGPRTNEASWRTESLVLIVELHFFRGLSLAQNGVEACSLSSTVRQYRIARAWLNAHRRDNRD